MKPKYLALSLLLAVLASTSSGVVSAQQSKAITLVAKDGSKIATIRVSAQSLLFEFSNNADSFFFSDEAVFTLNDKDKTYRVQSYADLQASVSQKAAEFTQSPEGDSPAQGVAFKLTEETETISGLRARKLIKTNQGEPEAELWVSGELAPASLRALGEGLRSILPKDYWSRVHGNPGMMEIVMLFGVPLRITYGHDSFEARVVESSDSAASFQVPAGYRRLAN